MRYEKVEVIPAISGRDGLAAKVIDLRYMGATVRIEATVNDGGHIIRSEMPTGARVSALTVGQDVLLSWPRDSAVLIES